MDSRWSGSSNASGTQEKKYSSRSNEHWGESNRYSVSRSETSTSSSGNGYHDYSPGSSSRSLSSRSLDKLKRSHSGSGPSIDVSTLQSISKLSIHNETTHELPEEELRERSRCSMVKRKKDFCHVERIKGRQVNILQGLELHTNVFSADEQKKVVDYVHNLQRLGQNGMLRARTYTEPSKWMRGKGRVTIQFGCCYNYAVDKNGNPPGIIRDEEVDPIPPLFKEIIKRLVRWCILPQSCVPNSCIVNLYDEGDCIPPHIDHHDFLRPFCTISFLAECNILFGTSLKVVDAGEFSGPVSIPLPVGSVLILNGNGADVAKHCVPAVPAKRISITFRKMDDCKLPYGFKQDPDLMCLQPLPLNQTARVQDGTLEQQSKSASGYPNERQEGDVHVLEAVSRPQFWKSKVEQNKAAEVEKANESPFSPELDEFPPLGSGSSAIKMKHKTR